MATIPQLIPNQFSELLELTSKLFDANRLFDASYEDDLLQSVVDALVKRYGYDVAYFRMIAPDGYLEIRKHAGTQTDYLHNPKERRMGPGEGLNGHAVLTGEVIAVPDVRENPLFRYPEVREREQLVGMLVVPLRSAGRPVGTLSCYTRTPHTFTHEEIQFASALASMTSVILSNNRYLEELNMLDDFGHALAQKSSLKEVINTIVTYAQQFSKSDGVRLFPYDAEKDLFVFHLQEGVGIGQGEGLARTRRPRKNGLTLQILDRGMFRLESEEINSSPLLSQETKEILAEEGIRAFAGLAIKTDVPLGVLYLNYKTPTNLPRPEELNKKFNKFLHHAAIAMERAWLFEYRQQEQKLLEFASHVTSDVRDVKDVWREFLSYAVRLTGATAGNISIVSRDGAYLDRLVYSGFPEYSEKQPRIGGTSLQSRAVKQKRSLLIANMRDRKSKDTSHAVLENTRSVLVAPVYASGSDKQRVTGVINLEHYEESAFDYHDLRLIELLSMHATIALKIAENYERIEKESARSRALQNAARAIITRSGQQDVLEIILQEAASLTGAHFATIQKRVGDHLQFQEILPASQWEPLHRLIPDGIMRLDGKGLTVQVARECRPILENDVTSNDKFWDGNSGQTLSELAVPMLMDNENLWGVLNVEKKVKSGFTVEDQEVLIALAHLALAAVQGDEYHLDVQREKNVESISHALSYLVPVHWLNNQISLMPAKASDALEELQNAEMDADLKEQLQKYLNAIVQKGHQITDRISRTYRPLTDRPRAVDLSLIREEVQEIVPVPAHIDLAFYLEPSAINVIVSPDMLVMLLENMFQNSIRQLQNGGRIWVRSEIIDSDWLYLHIYDNGEGIPPDKLKKLLQFSFNLGSQRASTPMKMGLGLGLPLAYWYVRKLGGDLQIESRVAKPGNPEHGTRITLKLPRVTEKQWERLETLVMSYGE